MQSKFTTLNFPLFNHKIKEVNQQTYIWDPIRKIWILLTPEEWVRQNLIQYFVDILVYPLGLMQTEVQIKVGKVAKRFDLVIMDNNLKPWLICECKAPNININAAVLEQAAIYNSTLKCPYLSVTNGLKHFCFEINFKTNSFQKMNDFPPYPA